MLEDKVNLPSVAEPSLFRKITSSLTTYVFVGLILIATVGYAYYSPTLKGFNISDRPDFPADRANFFSVVANNLKAPQLCEKISPYAYYVTEGPQYWYLQKQCKDGYSWGLILPKDARKFMNEMGYDDNYISKFRIGESDSLNHAEQLFKKVNQESEFKTKVNNLPSYNEKIDNSKIRPANPIEYLYQMVAITDKSAQLCGRISPDAYWQDESGRGLYNKGFLRDGCFYGVANSLGNVSICDNVSQSSQRLSVGSNESFLNKALCKEAVVAMSQNKNKTVWGYILPTSQDLLKVLGDLGYVETSPTPTDDSYWMYYTNLKFSNDTALPNDPAYLKDSVALKKDFVSRAEKLTDAM